ncbi:MAG: hypothetical protein SGPRY_007212 [Prymnesium sp.]
MLAFLGYVAVDAGFRLPGAPEVSSLLAHDAAVDNGAMLASARIPSHSMARPCTLPVVFQLLNDPDATAPGDYKFDPLKFSAKATDDAKKVMEVRVVARSIESALVRVRCRLTRLGGFALVPDEEKEIANGRAAMMAFSGIVTQAALTGNGFPYTF